ncbi:MAG: RNA 2',3'-cyclic phosphodiesterase [Dehalococcoidales bacterium]|nr:RNA 2',3'-cyclic phosphodiesterase [Dehalococcoidales bacterium]
MENTEQIRSFIAIELPEELKLELGRLQASLRVDRPRIKWVDPNSMHLTLKFLGNVPAAKIDAITRAMTESAAKISPFQLEVGRLGAFPSLKQAQVVWVGLCGELDRIRQLHAFLEASLSRLGFATEKRPFSPHLTQARVGNEASPDERQRLGELIATTSFGADKVIRVNSINLMRSQLTSQGAIYTKISSAELKQDR